MRIAHFAQFAPHRCGMFETVRDMIRAERLAGHEAELADIGIEGTRAVGEIDDRPGLRLVAKDYPDVKDFDVFVCNSSVPDFLLAETKAPVVQIMHGRPESSFRLSQKEEKSHPVYQLYSERANRPRWKMFVSLWSEHLPYWSVLIPDEKLVAVEAPCDLELHAPTGPKYEFKNPGRVNLLVADIWRDDTDPYNITHGIICAAKKFKGLKAHFFAVRSPLGPWNYLFKKLKELGALGDVVGHIPGIDHVIRAADLVATPHIIATRLVREALSCGTPVIAPHGSRHAIYTGSLYDPVKMGDRIALACEHMTNNPQQLRDLARARAGKFGLEKFGAAICRVYQEVLDGQA